MSDINSENGALDIEAFKYRMKQLEDNQKQSHEYFKHTLTAITIIFLFVGIVITVLSIISKNDVDTAIRDMERKFEILSNQALEKPELIATYEGIPIKNNDVINVDEFDQLSIPLGKVKIINSSKKPTNEVKVGIYFSDKIIDLVETSDNTALYGLWDIEDSFLNEFVSYALYFKQFKLNPTEIWSRPNILKLQSDHKGLNSLKAKMVVYYGVEAPLEIYFNLSVKQKN